MQLTMAVTGTGMSEGNKYDNLRIAATIIPSRWGILVRKDSDIHSIADLKGKSLPSATMPDRCFTMSISAFSPTAD